MKNITYLFWVIWAMIHLGLDFDHTGNMTTSHHLGHALFGATAGLAMLIFFWSFIIHASEDFDND